ncbi:hypothetical protein CAEBREN_03527 [Caenorhabditis brenneri]|uniref:RRM domain-containing protein n=1 Tax=Caenorhabditis brenneri TaxID=135651 RepID=G0NYM1_CAEBE|nr:hypothetical protein CAEBREN_03527 [Caenorhabditis brenneri]
MITDNFCDRLYVGGFSTTLSSDQIRTLISQSASPFEVTTEIVENGSRRHRGFAFVQCRSPAEASILLTKFTTLFTKVNYAKREPKPAENVMSNITNVFVRGISSDMPDTELYQAFGGVADGVVQCHVADGYGFVLFDTRANAQKKIAAMDGKVLNGKTISVSWARPDTMARKRKKPTGEERIATTKIDILKATDFRPMKRGHHNWCDDDQKMIDEMPRRGSNDQEGNGTVELVRDSNEKWGSRQSSAEAESQKEGNWSRKWSDKVEKKVAVKWELPTADYYPIRYDEHIRRNVNPRKPCGELLTAQEAPAVREKGEANDRTDQDCLTHPHDLHSSKESLTSSEATSTQRDKSPERKPRSIEPPKPVEEVVQEKVPEKIPEEVKKIEEEPKKVEEPKKEEPPKPEEKKKEVEEVKKEDPPVVVEPEKKPKKKVQINIKRHPDCGELTILGEKNGIVSFTCSTQHRVKSKKTKNEK